MLGGGDAVSSATASLSLVSRNFFKAVTIGDVELTLSISENASSTFSLTGTNDREAESSLALEKRFALERSTWTSRTRTPSFEASNVHVWRFLATIRYSIYRP